MACARSHTRKEVGSCTRTRQPIPKSSRRWFGRASTVLGCATGLTSHSPIQANLRPPLRAWRESSGSQSTTSYRRAASGRRRPDASPRSRFASSTGLRKRCVSLGAIGAGLPVLGLGRRPRSTPRLQAASAAGQVRLQLAWEAAFRQHGLKVAQVLLSAVDLAARASYLNVRNTLNTLLRLGVVPVVNENDATATDEITFGDNDALAAQVAVLLGARLLVLLTEVEGVYSGTAELLPTGDAVDDSAF